MDTSTVPFNPWSVRLSWRDSTRVPCINRMWAPTFFWTRSLTFSIKSSPAFDAVIRNKKLSPIRLLTWTSIISTSSITSLVLMASEWTANPRSWGSGPGLGETDQFLFVIHACCCFNQWLLTESFSQFWSSKKRTNHWLTPWIEWLCGIWLSTYDATPMPIWRMRKFFQWPFLVLQFQYGKFWVVNLVTS